MASSVIDKVIEVAVIIAVGVVLHIVARLVIAGIVKAAASRAEANRDATPTRASRFLAQAGVSGHRTAQRAKALGSVLKSVAAVVIWVLVALSALNAMGVNLTPIIAAAGVGGVALGFGAQSLVKDFLSGICLMVEDQYGVGDFVEIGTVKGTIEEISLRVTRLRDPLGKVWYVRNGDVVTVGNLSQGWSLSLVDIPVSYESNPDEVEAVLQKVCDELADDEQWDAILLEDPKVLGVESVTRGVMTMRISLKCAANQHWGISRELRAKAKEAFDAAGIAGPQMFEI